MCSNALDYLEKGKSLLKIFWKYIRTKKSNPKNVSLCIDDLAMWSQNRLQLEIGGALLLSARL